MEKVQKLMRKISNQYKGDKMKLAICVHFNGVHWIGDNEPLTEYLTDDEYQTFIKDVNNSKKTFIQLGDEYINKNKIFNFYIVAEISDEEAERIRKDKKGK